MKDINERAAAMLLQQCQQGANDPLNNGRKEAASHVLAHILGSDGFAILVASTRNGKTGAQAMAIGSLPRFEILEGLLSAAKDIAREFDMEIELTAKRCTCENRQPKNNFTVQ